MDRELLIDLLNLLRALQWSRVHTHVYDSCEIGIPACPVCDVEEIGWGGVKQAHSPDCALRTMIKRLEVLTNGD